MIINKRFALIFRLGAMMFALAGLLKQIGVFHGTLSFHSFMFYTIQSNLLAVVLFAYLSFRTAMSLRTGLFGNIGWHPRLGMIIAVDLLVTMVVFWTLLTPVVPPSYLWTFENIAIHTVTPLLCLLDFILFSEPRRLKYRDIYYTCIFPVFYVIFTSIAGLAGYVYGFSATFSNEGSAVIDTAPVRFPYFFMDFDRLGFTVLIYVSVMLAFFILLSHIIYFVDRKRRLNDKHLIETS